MAAGEPGCDGCGRTVSPETSTTVVMPNGERVTCCANCASHARAAAADASDRVSEREYTLDQRRGSCDGCRGTFLEVELEDIVLDDGTVITCCPSCAAEAPGRGNEPSGSDAAEMADGGSDTDTETENRCSQCSEPVAHELFRVTTVDGRTERLCRACKEDAAEEGIVKTVEMRATRAREVLGVDENATADEIRRAYHEQVKRAHPDRKTGSRSAFQLVTEAYERLRRTLEES